MSDTTVQRYYRLQSYVYDATRWTILHGRRRAAAALRLRPGSSVLEVGCGTGLNFRHVLAHLNPAANGRLIGLDFSADMLRRAARRVARHGWPHVELAQADATTMDLGRTFDAVYFAYSLTMIPNWPAALERAYAHLKPGGVAVVLDFSRFAGWGPLGALPRGWLRWNHVETERNYEDEIRRRFDHCEVKYWGGGYNFTAVGRRGA
ncbi:MAG: methyltransferase domain-containing protein [Phycisphaerales bacterium]|nr:methyltransferase domain-containing protein [Phycisphaerales bacterium]